MQGHERTDASRCAPPAVPRRAGEIVVAPDRSRSAYWNGSSATRDNATVYAGPDCTGERLFTATFVHADSAQEAAVLAERLGGRAAEQSLGAQGSTGPEADRLWWVDVPPSRVIDLTDS